MKKESSQIPSTNFELSIVDMLTNDPEVNSCILNRYLEKVYRNCESLVGKISFKYNLDRSVVEDMLQDAFMLLIEKIRSGEFTYNTTNQFYGWIGQVLKNKALSAIKKGYHSISLDQDENGPYNTYELSTEQPDLTTQTFISPSCSLEERVGQLIDVTATPKGAQVLKFSLLENISNAEGAKLMGYKDESVFRKKKSQYLKDMRDKMNNRQRGELIKLAS